MKSTGVLTLSAHIHYERHECCYTALHAMCKLIGSMMSYPSSLQQLLAVGLVGLSTFDFVVYFTLQGAVSNKSIDIVTTYYVANS